MEHVGVGHFGSYFSAIRGLLKEGGFALVHAIGRMSPPGTTAPFIRKYIFPGGYVPALSEVFASLERTGMVRRLREFATALLLDDPRLAVQL